MGEETAFKNGRIPTLKGSWPWLWPSIGSYCIPSCITHHLYLYTKFHWNWRNFFWKDGRTYGRADGHLRPTLLGRLGVDLKLLLPRLMDQYCFDGWHLSSSVVVVCNAAGMRAGWPPGAWAVGRPTLHGGPVRLRPVRTTPCSTRCKPGRRRCRRRA